MPWWQKLRTAKEAGYDYLEMSIDESDSRLARLDWNDTDIDALLQDCERENLPIRSMCLSGHRKYPMGSAARAEKSMDIMRKAICLADRMGIGSFSWPDMMCITKPAVQKHGSGFWRI